MRQRTLLVVAVGLIAAGLVGLTVLGLVVDVRFALNSPPDTRERGGRVDAMFIERMVPHHQDAIDMADLAASRAKRPEIRELAAQIKRSQSAENRQMRQWYRQWFGTGVPDVGDSGMMGGMMGGDADLARLREADDFDREFIEQMVPHHQMALMMAQMAGRSTRRPELRRLTESMIDDQSREIEDMQRWYREWYGQ